MKFANGDCVIARIGDKDQVGIIHKVSDLSTKDIPERTIFSVRFQSDVTRSHTFIHGSALTSNNTNIWTCPSSGKFEPLLKEVIAILYTFVRTRLTQVRRNIEREELLRDLIKTAERKKRIDALYGRNEKTR